MRQPKIIYLWNSCAFSFLAERFQPQWLELSQELGKAEYRSTSANDVFWSKKMPSAQLPRLHVAAKRQSGCKSCTIVFIQWSRTRLDVLAICQVRKAMEQRKHRNGSGRNQSRPMQAYPLRLSSVLKLRGLALKQYHQEHRASSGFGMCQS